MMASGWENHSDLTSTSRITSGRENIDGRERDVLIIEVNVTSGNGTYAGVALFNETIVQKLRTSSGVRFKVLGDGRNWEFLLPTKETLAADFSYHRSRIITQNRRVVDINIPYSQLVQPIWATRNIPFNRNNIMGLHFERNSIVGTGSSIIKIFDFEIY